MNIQENLFEKEEKVISSGVEILKQLENPNNLLAIQYYELLNHYKKLLKQTKLLVKVSDRQQRDKIYESQQTTISNEKRLAQFLEAIPLGVFVVDHERKPCYANRAAFQIFEAIYNPPHTMEELVEIYDYYIEQVTNDFSKRCLPLEQALLYGKSCSGEITLSIDQQQMPLEISSVPIFDQKNRVSYVIVIFKNISERKQSEIIKMRLIEEEQATLAMLRYSREIEEKNQQLIQLNQEKNEFLGVVAHDLKNPLSNIMSLSEIILENQINIEIKDFMEMIKTSADSMFTLITTLLDVNAIESGKINLSLQRENLLPILQQVLNDYKQSALQKNIRFYFECTPQDYYVIIDRNIARQILDNIISNAIKYSPLGKNIYVRLFCNQYMVKCEVQDEGQGLSKEDLSKLFNKFTRLKPQPTAGEHSTGLGLFIVKKLIEKMDGKVWCESELRRGSTFIVEFNRAN
jgi:signal transduction histidine kinase